MAKKNNNLREVDYRALRFIRHQIASGGGSPSVRELAKELDFKAPRSAALAVNRLIGAGYLKRRPDQSLQVLRLPDDLGGGERTVPVPLVGVAPCGAPFLAVENIEAMVPVSTKLATPGHRYFLLRVMGESMDRAGIPDGSLVLVRQQSTAEDGDVIVALVDDAATIKEFYRSRDAVILRPRSSNVRLQPILVTTNLTIQGRVVSVFPPDGKRGKRR